jgi:hypothetical protein
LTRIALFLGRERPSNPRSANETIISRPSLLEVVSAKDLNRPAPIVTEAIAWRAAPAGPQGSIGEIGRIIGEVIKHAKSSNLAPGDRALSEIERARLTPAHVDAQRPCTNQKGWNKDRLIAMPYDGLTD